MHKKPTVCAYGFDKLGFVIPGTAEEELFFAQFLGYNSNSSFEQADGLVIPSAIFEELHYSRPSYGMFGPYIRCDEDQLATREKQLINAYKSGAWIVFLVQELNHEEGNEPSETDLAKKWLKPFIDGLVSHKPNAHVACKADAFREFMKDYGIAQNYFRISDRASTRILAEENNEVVGFEAQGNIFFLPFFTTKTTRDDLLKIIRLVGTSVLDYKKLNDISLPRWVAGLKFNAESRLQKEVRDIEERLLELRDEIATWERYKAILCASGDNLNLIVVEILRDFFKLNVKSEEKHIEDALIYSDVGEIKYVLEIKGVNGGIKRDHIDQLDSHRERLRVPAETAGLLIVNDFRGIEDFEDRKSKLFDSNHLARAVKDNVKILRTVTLFEIMRLLEDQPDRKDKFFAYCEQALPLFEIDVQGSE